MCVKARISRKMNLNSKNLRKQKKSTFTEVEKYLGITSIFLLQTILQPLSKETIMKTLKI